MESVNRSRWGPWRCWCHASSLIKLVKRLHHLPPRVFFGLPSTWRPLAMTTLCAFSLVTSSLFRPPPPPSWIGPLPPSAFSFQRKGASRHPHHHRLILPSILTHVGVRQCHRSYLRRRCLLPFLSTAVAAVSIASNDLEARRRNGVSVGICRVSHLLLLLFLHTICLKCVVTDSSSTSLATCMALALVEVCVNKSTHLCSSTPFPQCPPQSMWEGKIVNEIRESIQKGKLKCRNERWWTRPTSNHSRGALFEQVMQSIDLIDCFIVWKWALPGDYAVITLHSEAEGLRSLIIIITGTNGAMCCFVAYAIDGFEVPVELWWCRVSALEWQSAQQNREDAVGQVGRCCVVVL